MAIKSPVAFVNPFFNAPALTPLRFFRVIISIGTPFFSYSITRFLVIAKDSSVESSNT